VTALPEARVDVDDFVTLFGDGCIRARLNWSRLRSDCWIEQSFSRSRDELGDLFTVWYAGADGAHADFRDPGARPLRLREVGLTEATWPAQRLSRIAALHEQFAAADRPVQLPLPVYALGGGSSLLLDGTHRSVAAYRSGADVRLLLFAMHGPVDASMLPDLGHHQASATE
jgi:hypothetical protein